ncbi:MAG: hypothetical protein IPM31_05645 [Anaerolineae bacterium]|nr:hypothetical protein [Anaerolineae bacterium]MBL8105583.1 hypothetical protein [Anaerolineales bacterium]MCC7189230.1 hypothetical protein [Anaerolineales bacterium]
MNDSTGPFIILGILALVAILKGQFWAFLSMAAGTFIGILLGMNFEDDLLGFLLIGAVIYFVGKFIGNAITRRNTESKP